MQGERRDPGQYLRLHGRIANHPATLVRLGLAGLKLRLYEGDEEASGPQETPHGREHRLERNEGEIHHHGVVLGARKGARLQMAGIDFLEAGDPGIGAQARVQLIATHVNGRHVGGAGLQRAISEAAGGRADVEHVGVPQVDAKLPQKTVEFLAAATDKARRLLECKGKIRGIFLARLVEPLRTMEHPAGHDQRLRLSAGLGEAALDEEDVEALLLRALGHA